MSWMSTLFRAITKLEEHCIAWGILGITVLTIANVLLRSLLGFSLFFAEELSRFLIVLVTFLGLGYAASRGRHIRMTALYDVLPSTAQKKLMLIITLSTSALLFYLSWVAVRYVFDTVRVLGGVSPVLQIPKYLVYAAAPLGLFLGGVQYALAFVKNFTEREVYLSFEHKDEYDEQPPREL